MEGELIFLGFIMLVGQIILMQMWQNGWFKKENFKIQKSIVMAENKLKLRKLEREMGLAPDKTLAAPVKEERGTLDKLGGIVELLQGLDGDTLKGLAERFLGDSEDAAPQGTVDRLIDFAEKNPEIATEFLKQVIPKTDSTARVIYED